MSIIEEALRALSEHVKQLPADAKKTVKCRKCPKTFEVPIERGKKSINYCSYECYVKG